MSLHLCVKVPMPGLEAYPITQTPTQLPPGLGTKTLALKHTFKGLIRGVSHHPTSANFKATILRLSLQNQLQIWGTTCQITGFLLFQLTQEEPSRFIPLACWARVPSLSSSDLRGKNKSGIFLFQERNCLELRTATDVCRSCFIILSNWTKSCDCINSSPSNQERRQC